jgi:hypothetical protein
MKLLACFEVEQLKKFSSEKMKLLLEHLMIWKELLELLKI